RQRRQVLAVPQPVGDHRGRHDDGRVPVQRLVVHVLEALRAHERRLVLVPGERQRRLAPEPGQEVDLGALLRETVGVVPDLVLVEVALQQDPDPLPGEPPGHEGAPAVASSWYSSLSRSSWSTWPLAPTTVSVKSRCCLVSARYRTASGS